MLNPSTTAFQSSVLESSIQSSSQILSSQGQFNGLSVSLPKLQLLTFSGDIQQWPEFWDMFNSSVHEQNLPKVSKFSYLKGVLKGSTAAAISGTVQENANHYASSERNKFVEATTRSMNRFSADVFTNNVRGARRLPCIFCKRSHYNDECDKYVRHVI